jgi:hypothetical protein
MIVIDIFEENHRFSKKTPYPAPHSVVDAAMSNGIPDSGISNRSSRRE